MSHSRTHNFGNVVYLYIETIDALSIELNECYFESIIFVNNRNIKTFTQQKLSATLQIKLAILSFPMSAPYSLLFQIRDSKSMNYR